MHRLLTWIGISLGVLALGGCAAIGFRTDLRPTDRQQIKSIGVVSMLGDTFRMDYRGTTIFQNKLLVLDVPDWHVDAFAGTEAAEAIAEIGDYEVQVITLDEPGVEKAIAAARAAGLDAVMTINSVRYDNAPATPPGISFLRANAFGNRYEVSCAVISANIHLARTGQRLAFEWGFPTSGPFCMTDDSVDGKPWSESVPWPSSAEDLPDEDLQRFRRDAQKVLSRNVRYAVTHLGL